jgi:hypothetical protein
VGVLDRIERIFRIHISSHLIGFPDRFEFSHIFIRELLPDFFKMGHGLRSVQTLPTMQAYFSFHLQDGCIGSASEDLFDLLLCELASANGAFIK